MSSMSLTTPTALRAWARQFRVPSTLMRYARAKLIAQDRRASQRGWTVTSGRWGSRTYRDPRFDSLARSAEMGGSATGYLEALVLVPVVGR